jgi:hypothetical protein
LASEGDFGGGIRGTDSVHFGEIARFDDFEMRMWNLGRSGERYRGKFLWTRFVR